MTEDSGMSQRERRRQQYQKNKPKVQLDAGDLKKWAGPAVLLLLVGGVVTAMVLTSESADECPGHWHAEFNVVVDGQKLTYQHPSYDLNRNLPLSYHMHQSNDHQIHFEPPTTECLEMGDFLERVDTHIATGELVLDGGHADLGQAGTYTDSGNSTFRVFHTPTGSDDDWTIISPEEMLKRQPLNGERILFIYGDYTDEELQSFQSSVPYISGADPAHPTGS